MKSVILICAGLIVSFTHAYAQSWFKGSVTLSDQQVLTGDISIDTQYDLILLKNEQIVDVYPAHRIYSARIYDSKANINRRFVSLRDQINPRICELFEIVISGEIAVIRREVSRYDATIEHDALGYAYYVLFENELISLKDFNPKIYSKLKESDLALTSFVKKHRLNPNKEANALQIIQHYNKQSASAELVSK